MRASHFLSLLVARKKILFSHVNILFEILRQDVSSDGLRKSKTENRAGSTHRNAPGDDSIRSTGPSEPVPATASPPPVVRAPR